MKFFVLVALVGYTEAIRIDPNMLEPGCIGGLAAAANSVSCPGNKSPVEVAAATHGWPAGVSTDKDAIKNIRAQTEGPNGTIHDERRFDPPPRIVQGSLSQIEPNILEPGCIGGLAAAANSVSCPGNKSPVEVSAATHGWPAGLSTDAGAIKNIRAQISGPDGTIHDERRFDPRVAAVPAAPGPVVVPNIHPGTTLTPYVVPVALAQVEGPNGTIHDERRFDPPPRVVQGSLAQVEGPNGTIHDERRFDPPPRVVQGSLSQVEPNYLKPACMGGLTAAENTIVCPGQESPVAVSAATHGLDGIITDKDAIKNIRAQTSAPNQGPTGTIHDERRFDLPPVAAAPPAPAAPPVVGGPNIHPGTTLTPYVAPVALAQTSGPNGTIHVEGTFDPAVVPGGSVASDATPQTPAALPLEKNIHPGTTLIMPPSIPEVEE